MTDRKFAHWLIAGIMATTALIRLSKAARCMTWPPPNDTPQAPIRLASTSGWPASQLTALRRSSSWFWGKIWLLGSPPLSPKVR